MWLLLLPSATIGYSRHLPFQCCLKAWMSKYSPSQILTYPLYRLHSVGDWFSLGATLRLDLDLFFLEASTLFLWTWMESTGWKLHWQKATYTFPIRIGSTFLFCPSRTEYSLVLLIGSGIGPIGVLSGLKGFILLNSSGLRQRVKNRYSQHVVRLRLLLLSRCSKKYRSTECEDRLDWWILFFRTLNDIIDRCASHRAIPDYPLSKVLNELCYFTVLSIIVIVNSMFTQHQHQQHSQDQHYQQ